MNLDQTMPLDRELKEMFAAKKLTETASTKTDTKAMVTAPAVALSEDDKKMAQEKAEREKESESATDEPKPNAAAIHKSLQSINQFIPIINTNLVFEFDDLNDPPIIKVIDKESKELIREIPSRELDKLAKAFSEMADTLNKSGALFNTEI
jgi:flagellar protein FlaG